MNKNRPLVVVGLMLFTASAGAFNWPWEKEVIPADQVIPKSMEQFDKLQTRIDDKYKGKSDHYQDYSHLVTLTRNRFKEKASSLHQESSTLELMYLGDQVSGVLVPELERRIKAYNKPIGSEEERQKVERDLEERSAQDSKKVEANFVSNHMVALQAFGEKIASGATTAVGADLPPTTGTNNGSPNGTNNGEQDGGSRTVNHEWGQNHAAWELALSKVKDSPLVKIGRESAEWAKKQSGTDDPGGGGNTSGGGGKPRWPRWNSPRDDDPNAASNAWVSNAIANSGGKALASGDFSGAARMAQNALQLNPQNENALNLLSQVKGRVDGGMTTAAGGASAAAGALALGSGGADAGFAGGAGSARPSPEIAAAAAAGAARVSGLQTEASVMAAFKIGDTAGGVKLLDKELSLNPKNPALLNLRARAYGSLGQWDKALADAEAGLALVPNNPTLLKTKALALNRLHRYKEALEASNALLAVDPKSAWGYAARAHAYGGLGNRAAMMADINQAALLDPNFRRAADEAATLQLPTDADVLFLFPGERPASASKAPAPGPGRARSFGVVMGAGIVGGLLLALGLLSVALEPIKKSVSSVFTKRSAVQPRANAVATAQPASSAGEVGGLIRGQYEIARQIGAGGMGMVYEGTDRSLGRRVAIKKMRDELRLNPRERDRFVIEAKTVASLHHPNIVDIYAIAEEGDDVYLVFEFVDGKTIHDLVQSKGRLSVPESVGFTKAMGEALTYAHAHGVIHRDMKPSNVMQTSDGRIKVMDFGIARMAKDAMTRYSMTNTVVGTPPYMAPEQEQGVVRKESDVYALAICAYEMLTGKLPFIGMGAGMLMNKINMSYIPPSRNIAGLPESLDEVFLKAFQADPERRYRTPAEFVAALSAAADGARSKSA